ncbi:LysR substrate-binding domain-containing protein [Noviherbaspirillum sp. CPCC 100848]|uniref:LysR substrate-binding domain-containing protein n=1 Tax=Noviherbaspirillum album TaxID=3080276 RepID=A0ABU6JEG6_9BURK|nr:LysR substrate-binding domain-containing protein [Noviherbaspirillum sp. CPCC 100848]MEC4722042.1 LysR substrate-binding domain-containing protein [Noviherbaspirillum sp. CPCC 100848]
MSQPLLELDVLKTFAAGIDVGSFARAAEKVGRSQSAVSLQMKKLEEQLNIAIFEKQGRSLALTAAGKTLYDYAKRMLELNEEAVGAVRGIAVDGEVRFGMSVDFENTWLPATLARFTRSHGNVTVEIRIDRNAVLSAQIERGEVDIALLFTHDGGPGSERIADVGMAWLGRPDLAWKPEQPLPLLLLEQPCVFTHAALQALDAARVKWRIVATSPSLGGLWAAAEAGMGLTVRTGLSMPRSLTDLGTTLALPPLPSVGLFIKQSVKAGGPAVMRLRQALLDVLQEQL